MKNNTRTDSNAYKPWGSNFVDLKLAGAYRVTGLTEAQVQVICERFSGAVVVPPSNDDVVTICVFRTDENDLQAYTPRIPTEILRTSPEDDRIWVDGYHFEALVHWSPDFSGWIRTCESEGLSFRLAFENFFRLMVAHSLLKKGALLVHSGAVVEHGRADVFVGCSGYGKSTISGIRKAEGATVLSDDMVALSVISGKLHAQALPFTGDLPHWPGLGDQFQVRAVMNLKKGRQNHLSEPLSAAKSMSTLMVCCPYVNTDAYRNDQLMDNIAHLIEASKFHTLTFVKEKGIGRFLDSNLK